MPLKAQSSDGVVHEFPDGTAPDVIDKAMKDYVKQQAPPDVTTRMERLGMGAADPFYGAAQLGARMGEEGIPGPGALELQQQRIGQVDKTVREREAAYQSRRGGSKDTDWLRAVGSIPSTVALTSPLMAIGGMPGAIMLGAGSGAIQPATDFGKEKPGQIGMGAALGGGFGLLGKGVSALGSWFAREFPNNVMTQAVQRILRRASQDERAGGPSAAAIIDLVNEARRTGKPMSFVDPAGQNVRGLAGRVTREPGEARDFAHRTLNERQTGASGRLRDDLARFVHSEQGMLQTTEALQAARSGASSEPYRRALDPTRIVDSPFIRQVLNDPIVRGGIREGIESQRLESLATGKPFSIDAAKYLTMDEAGNITGVKGVPNMGVLDAVKKGLDRLIEKERNDLTGKLSSRGVDIDRVRRAFLTEVDRINPEYAQARAVWSGYSASLDALKSGRAALQNTPEEIAAEFGALSPGDQEFYRLGIADKLRERLMKAGLTGNEAQSRNQANALLNSDWMRDQLRPLFRSPQDAQAFMRAVNAEHLMFATRSELVRGSQTAGRLAEDTAGQTLIEQHGAGVTHDVANKNWLGLLMRIGSVLRDRVKDRELVANQAVNNQVARLLFGPIDEGAAQALLRGLSGPRVRLENPMQFPAAVLQRASPLAIPAATAGGPLAPGQ